MPQLGRFDETYHDPGTGRPRVGASVTVFREGATVNGNPSGTSPLTVTVRHRGKIVSTDSVFVNAATATTYTATVLSATSIQLSGFAGTLNLLNGDRLTPSGTQPTLYADDQAGATTANPLTTSSLGRANCWIETGAYDVVVSGVGLSASAFISQVAVGEAPAIVFSGETDSATAVAHAEDTKFSLTTAGAKLKSFRNLASEKASIDKDGTGIFPRIGQTSTATTGGALRVIDGNVFPLTVAGVQAALDECEAAGGGTVMIPAAAGISITNTSVKLGNRVKLIGLGDHASTATFVAANTANVSAMVENKTQDGTQQYAYVDGISLNGNKGGGATVTAGLYIKGLFTGSKVIDVLVINCSGNGIKLDAGTVGVGQMVLENIAVASCNDDNILLTSACDSVWMYNISSESAAAGKAAMRITRGASGTASARHCIWGFHTEGTAASDGLVLNECCDVMVDGASDDGNGSALNLIKITGSTGGSDGAFAAGGHTLRNIMANLTTIIDDQVAGVTVGNAQGRFVRWYSSPVASATLDTAQIIGLQPQRVGVSITAAATITPGEGGYFVVTGNTGITSITATARDKGRIIILNFSGTPTITDGSNLKMAGNLVATADDTLTMVCDGTNWIEIARSVN